MSNDFETIDYEEIDTKPDATRDRPDDFMSIIVDKVYAFDWIILLAVAISFIVVASDTYGDHVLGRFSGALTAEGELSTYGYILQLISLLIGTVLSRMGLALAGL